MQPGFSLQDLTHGTLLGALTTHHLRFEAGVKSQYVERESVDRLRYTMSKRQSVGDSIQ